MRIDPHRLPLLGASSELVIADAGELQVLAGRIRGVFEDDAGVLQVMVTPKDLCGIAAWWSPEASHPLPEGIVPFGVITTLHTFGAHWMFKPSLGETLSQIPLALRERTRAVWTQMDSEDFSDDRRYHRGRTLLFEAFRPGSGLESRESLAEALYPGTVARSGVR